MPDAPSRRPRPLRLTALVALVLAAPIVPAVVYGEAFANWAEAWRNDPPALWLLAVAVTGVLALDIVLPVPSGPLTTLAGAQLGWLLATLVAWVGMMIGATAAFAATRRFGPTLVHRLASANDRRHLGGASGAGWVWLLLATRPVPVLAEATVLMAGLAGASWRQFLLATGGGSLLVAGVYAAVGRWAAMSNQVVPALIATSLVPVALGMATRAWLQRRGGGRSDV